MRTFFVSLIFTLALQVPALAADDAADITDAKTAFRAAYAQYDAAIEDGDADAALAAATEALELGPQVFADDSPSLAALYVNKGNALLDVRKYDEAIEILKDGVSRFRRIYGNNDEHLIDPLWSLANAYRRKFEWRQAARSMSKAMNLIEMAYGAQDHLFGDANQALGEIYVSFGNGRGLKYLKRSYSIFEALYGDQAYQTGLAAFWLGKWDYAHKKPSEAEANFLEALRIFEKTTPPGREFDIGAHSFLVRLYEEQGDSDKATIHCQAISLIRPKAEVDGYFPLYKKQPIYPRSAERANKSGYVLVEFTVTKSGSVSDPVIVESEGHRSFEKAALDAVNNFRYAPAVVNGELVDTSGVRNLITFEMMND